jgi:mono/diheme cytochrome c family protein
MRWSEWRQHSVRTGAIVGVLVLLVAVPAAVRAAEGHTDAPDYNADVRPILSSTCFKCHGPDDKARKGKLRLDVRDLATKPAKSGDIAIVPGNVAHSELIKRITSTDEDEVMPPPASQKTLSPPQKDILKRWIAAGAEYRPHWAFVPPVQAPLPVVAHAAWARTPIDHFVAAHFEAEGLEPSPPADRYTLIRRVSLDLIGLPPTPAEADDFVADTAPDAYEKLVDRLLAMPQYGERWARRWLDLARYSDTNGYEKDRPRSMWPYRDWVIGAFNADHALRPLHHRPDRRRPGPGCHAADHHRHRLPPQYHAERRRGHRSARIPLLLPGRSRRHHREDLARADPAMRPMPHAQV